LDNPRLLFFPDFEEPFPFWQRVLAEYCKTPIGQLLIYLPDDENKERYNQMLGETISYVSQGTGDIAAQFGGINSEDELFAAADCFITSRCLQTVKRTCLADKYGVKIISCADTPMLRLLIK
jgi:hypothetical protein